MRKDITFLASDECEGRGVETKGINLAADYIAGEFEKSGLKPGVEGKSWFQPFTMSGASKLESPNTLKLRGPLGQEIELEINKHFRPLGLSGSGKLTAPLVFAGYSATAKDINYDDFQGLDVAGKIVVILRRTPRGGSTQASFDGDRSGAHASLTTKVTNAEEHKAAGVIIINDSESAKGNDPLIDFGYTARGGASRVPVVHIRRSLGDTIFQSVLGSGVREIEQDIDRDLKPRSAPLTGWTANLEVNVRRQALNVKNIVGVIEGAGPLAKETIVIGAHYDHLGYGGMGSLAKNLKQPAIHHGADDNGSGSTSLIELARRFGGKKNYQGRRLVFIAFSGEEMGLFGSDHYCKKPIFPLEETAAMVNLDMVGRLRPDDKTKKDKLQVHGTGTAKGFDDLIESLNENYHFHLQKIPGGTGPSDHASFYMRKVPVFFLFTGDHPDYHRPSDTADKINVAGMRKVCDLTEDIVTHLATAAERPEYVKVQGGGSPGGPAGPRIGIRPDYGDEKEGVLISGVIEGGPASRAGMKGGDRIVEIGGKQAKDLQTYMVLMSRFKKGDKVELGVVRDGQKMSITVVPE